MESLIAKKKTLLTLGFNNMKVYIILDEANDLGMGAFVKKVFSSKEKAFDYLYNFYTKYSCYAGKSKEDLRKKIDREIHEEEVE